MGNSPFPFQLELQRTHLIVLNRSSAQAIEGESWGQRQPLRCTGHEWGWKRRLAEQVGLEFSRRTLYPHVVQCRVSQHLPQEAGWRFVFPDPLLAIQDQGVAGTGHCHVEEPSLFLVV